MAEYGILIAVIAIVVVIAAAAPRLEHQRALQRHLTQGLATSA